MRLLRCKLCHGEVDIIGNFRLVNKKIKCRKCKFTNSEEKQKEPEIIIYRSSKKSTNS